MKLMKNIFILNLRSNWEVYLGEFTFISHISVNVFLFSSVQRGDWPMHKLECVAMCAYGENWCPSETVRLVARMIMKQVKKMMWKTKVIAFSWQVCICLLFFKHHLSPYHRCYNFTVYLL